MLATIVLPVTAGDESNFTATPAPVTAVLPVMRLPAIDGDALSR